MSIPIRKANARSSWLHKLGGINIQRDSDAFEHVDGRGVFCVFKLPKISTVYVRRVRESFLTETLRPPQFLDVQPNSYTQLHPLGKAMMAGISPRDILYFRQLPCCFLIGSNQMFVARISVKLRQIVRMGATRPICLRMGSERSDPLVKVLIIPKSEIIRGVLGYQLAFADHANQLTQRVKVLGN